jgi:hypothetical protein
MRDFSADAETVRAYRLKNWSAAERDARRAAASGSDAALAGALAHLHALAYPPMSPTARIQR